MKKGNAQASVNPESNKKSEGVGAAGGKEGIEKGVHQRLVYKDKQQRNYKGEEFMNNDAKI